MTRQVSYELIIDIPFNRETTVYKSNNKELQKSMIDESIETIQSFIASEKYISLEKVFEIMGARLAKGCPHIFLSALEDYELYEDEETGDYKIRLFMYNSFELRPVHKYERGQYDEKPDLSQKEVQTEWTEKSNDGPKGTSESEENETT